MIPLFVLGMLLALIGWFVLRVQFHRQASLRYNAGDYPGALVLYNRLTRFYPRDPMAFRNRALVHMQLGEAEAALSDLDTAINRSPREVGLRLERATLFTHLMRYEDAEHELNLLENINPESPQVYLNRAWFYIKQGRYDDGSADIQTAESLLNEMNARTERFGVHAGGDDAQMLIQGQIKQVHSLRGAALVRTGDFDAAFNAYEQALALAPNDVTTHNDIGEAHFTAGNYDDALATFEQAGRLLDDDEEAPAQTMSGQTMREFVNAGMAVTLFKLDRVDHALAKWRVLAQNDAHYRDPAWVRNELNWTEPMVETASHIIDRMAANKPEQPDLDLSTS